MLTVLKSDTWLIDSIETGKGRYWDKGQTTLKTLLSRSGALPCLRFKRRGAILIFHNGASAKENPLGGDAIALGEEGYIIS